MESNSIYYRYLDSFQKLTVLSLKAIFDFVSNSEGMIALGIGITGIYYFFLGRKYKKFSNFSVIFVITLSFLFQLRPLLSDFVILFNLTIRNMLPSVFGEYFDDQNALPFLILLSTFLTSVIFFLISWIKFASLGLVFYILNYTLQASFESYFTKYSKFYCLIFVLAVTFVIYCLENLIVYSITGFSISMLGTAFICLACSTKFRIFNGFKELFEKIFSGDLQIFNTPAIYAFICCSLISYWIQQ